MTLFDLFKLIRHHFKLVILMPIVCVVVFVLLYLVAPQTYEAKSTLLTNGDIALAGGFAQSEAELYSQNGITVSCKTDTAYRTITITAQGSDYGGCIAAANATVTAAAVDVKNVNDQVSVSTNEATYAESRSLGLVRGGLIALCAGLLGAILLVIVIDLIRTPIKSRNDIESASGLSLIGTIPNRDRGERLLANVRFMSDAPLSTIAVIPVGHTGGALTCAELASAFEYSKIDATRIQGNPHAQGLNTISLPEIVTIIECAPLSDGVGAIYIAKEADITILCVTEWRDTRKALAELVEELRFARVKIGGVVFLTTGYGRMQ